MSSLLASTEMLIEHYEQNMRVNATRSSALTSFMSPMNALLDITEGVEEALNTNPTINSNNVQLTSGTSANSQQGLGDQNTCEDEPEEEGLIPEAKWGIEESIETKTYLDLTGEMDEETAQNLEECWSCDLRAEFDWEIKPVNFLAEIEDLLNDIEDAIDHVIDATNPHNLLDELCPLFNLDSEFSWMCAPDLIALLQGIQLVLSRYLSESLSFTLNWTAIIGPLIRFIADNLTMCMENIRNIILAPINCINSVLKTASQIQDEFNDLVGTVVTTGTALNPGNSSIKQLFEGDNYSGNRKIGWSNPKDEEGNFARGEYLSGQERMQGYNTSSSKGLGTGVSFNYNANLNDLLQKNKRKYNQGLTKVVGEKLSTPDGKEMPSVKWAPNAIIPTLKDANGWVGATDRFLRTDSKGNPVNLLQKMILTMNSAESIINNLFANLIFTIKSLNKLVVGNLSLNIRVSGIILFLVDLMNLGKIWLDIIQTQGIEGFKNLCKDLEDEDSDVYNRIKHPFWSDNTASRPEDRNNNPINDNDENCGITEE